MAGNKFVGETDMDTYESFDMDSVVDPRNDLSTTAYRLTDHFALNLANDTTPVFSVFVHIRMNK